jgi:hypothetical protein
MLLLKKLHPQSELSPLKVPKSAVLRVTKMCEVNVVNARYAANAANVVNARYVANAVNDQVQQ